MQVSLEQLAQWLEQPLQQGHAQQTVHGVSIDSRAVVPGNLFVALRGERFDAHDYLAQVVAQGAVAVVVEQLPPGLTIPAIVVPDSRLALGRIAHCWRQQFSMPLLAVTGSNGKTTVKEMLASILCAAFGAEHSLATKGNFNNEIGVPLTLLRLQSQHQAAVVELGMNHPGEIAVLAEMARPTLALVNNAQREHQEFMSTVEAVARENGAVFSSLAADGVAVFPAEDEHAWVWREMIAARSSTPGRPQILSFGLSEQADVSATYASHAAGSLLNVRAGHAAQAQRFQIRLAAIGQHNVRNALAATACALGAGIEIDAIVRGLEAFAPVSGRMQQQRASNGAWLIDDTYNANPDSVRAAIDVLAHMPAPRLLVLGDMGEVGSAGQQFHEEIGAYAQAQGIDHFFGFGAAASFAVQAFNAGATTPAARHFDHIDALNAAALQLAAASVLIKGSRFMKMERVVQHLVGAQPSAPQSLENH